MTTTYWRNRMLKVAFFVGTTEFYIGLTCTLPKEDGTGVSEPLGNGYARVKIHEFTSPEYGEVHNPETINFPISTGVWFTTDMPATHWCLFDGPGSTAKLLTCGPLTYPIAVRQNVLVRFPAGMVSIKLEDDTVNVQNVLQDEDNVVVLNAGIGVTNILGDEE